MKQYKYIIYCIVTHNRSENGRGAEVALRAHTTHTHAQVVFVV